MLVRGKGAEIVFVEFIYQAMKVMVDAENDCKAVVWQKDTLVDV